MSLTRHQLDGSVLRCVSENTAADPWFETQAEKPQEKTCIFVATTVDKLVATEKG